MSDFDRLLYDLGITPNLLGFRYLHDVTDVVNASKRDNISMIRDLYQVVADKYGVTWQSVERSIRHAISKSISLDHGEIRNLIGVSPYKNKVSNSEFIFSLAYAKTK